MPFGPIRIGAPSRPPEARRHMARDDAAEGEARHEEWLAPWDDLVEAPGDDPGQARRRERRRPRAGGGISGHVGHDHPEAPAPRLSVWPEKS